MPEFLKFQGQQHLTIPNTIHAFIFVELKYKWIIYLDMNTFKVAKDTWFNLKIKVLVVSFKGRPSGSPVTRPDTHHLFFFYFSL